MSNNLPPLPEPEYGPTGYAGLLTPYQPSYSLDQIRAYGQQCWNHALEEAALASRYLPGFTYEQCSLFENAVLALRGET